MAVFHTDMSSLHQNPSVTSSCENFQTGRSYCVEGPPAPKTTAPSTTAPVSTSTKPSSTQPTTTKTGNGVTTPTPTQPGMVGNCNAFHFVAQGEACGTALRSTGISLVELFAWNPSVNADCTGLWAGVYVCVGVIGSDQTTTLPPSATTTAPGGGVQTPQPTQPGMVDNCEKFAFVNPGDSCSAIASRNGITPQQLAQWNTGVGDQCQSMWANVYVCVAVAGPQPATSTTTGSAAIQTPQPTQPGMVANCNKFTFVKPGDTCSAIINGSGITLQQFIQWNSGVGDQCQAMWANSWVCISVGGATPTQAPQPGNGVQTPTPTQSNMTRNCKSFHLVQPGQGCWAIANQYGISVDDFIRWNPDAKPDCSGLWANTYACVAVL